MRWDFVNETKVPPRASNESNLVRSSSLIASLYEGMNEDEEKKKGREKRERENVASNDSPFVKPSTSSESHLRPLVIT